VRGKAGPVEPTGLCESRESVPVVVLVLVKYRKTIEIPLDALGKVVSIPLDDAQLCLAAVPLAARASLDPRSGPFGQPRPLGADHDQDGACEEHHREDAHDVIVAA
jgi:hypothetical protein